MLDIAVKFPKSRHHTMEIQPPDAVAMDGLEERLGTAILLAAWPTLRYPGRGHRRPGNNCSAAVITRTGGGVVRYDGGACDSAAAGPNLAAAGLDFATVELDSTAARLDSTVTGLKSNGSEVNSTTSVQVS
jgi:hypothetical protein